MRGVRPLSELHQLAIETRLIARHPKVIECLDALIELTAAKPAAFAAKPNECPGCAARREAKRIAQAKWRKGKRND